jgi:hypothetical protein
MPNCIILCLRSSLHLPFQIVSQVQLLERLQSVSANKNKWSPIFDVRNTLLEKFGDQNPEHVLNLVTLLEESNIPAEKFEALSNHARCLNSTRISGTDFPVNLNKKMLTSYRRAFFDLDNAYIDVFITEVYSPAKIFVRHEKFDKLLKTLEDDLCNYWSTVKERQVFCRAFGNFVTLGIRKVSSATELRFTKL